LVAQRKEHGRLSRYAYRVEGTSCSHGAAAAAEEVGRIAGENNVEVGFEREMLQHAGEIDVDDVRAAVEGAGQGLA
jgi:copper chaperone CopZ